MSSAVTRDHLVCNSRGCYQQIENSAWVTLCSHVFCSDHGRELKQRLTANPGLPCPACGSLFRDDQSLLERKLNHPVQIRAMQLCGYNPEMIMEIASVAIAFWNHQKQQLCGNLVRKNEYYKETLLAARKEFDDATEQLRRAKMELAKLEQARVKLRELEQDKMAAAKRSRHDRGPKKPKREEDFLL